MKFVFTNKGNFETDIITDILKSENIRYQIKSTSPFHNDISIDTSYEHFLFVKQLYEKKITPYINAEINYALPDYERRKFVTVIVEPNTSVATIDKIQKQLETMDFDSIFEVDENPPKKKSKLLRLIDWFKGI